MELPQMAKPAHGWHGDTTDEKESWSFIRGIAMPSVGTGVFDESDSPNAYTGLVSS